jgi:hypothetical protein
MTDADELARRYLALWTEYLTAFLADPRALETMKRWIAFTGQFAYPAPGEAGTPGEGDSTPLPPLPPIFGPFGPLPTLPAAAGGADAVAVLTRRVDEIERRLAALESNRARRPAARRVRRGSRPGGE